MEEDGHHHPPFNPLGSRGHCPTVILRGYDQESGVLQKGGCFGDWTKGSKDQKQRGVPEDTGHMEREEGGTGSSVVVVVVVVLTGVEEGGRLSTREVSEGYKISSGVRHKCIMSSWHFNVYMDALMKEVKI